MSLRQCVLDTETTGISVSQGHRVIEIGVVEIIDRKITGNFYHVYLNPEREIDAGAVKVHGITSDFLKNKPKFIDINQQFQEFIAGSELLAHNAPFDIGFIEQEWSYLGLEQKVVDFCRVVDTLALARKAFPGQKNNLNILCKRLGVDLSKRSAHGALLDAELLAAVYLLMTGSQQEISLALVDSVATGAITAESLGEIARFKLSAADLAEHAKLLELMQEKVK